MEDKLQDLIFKVCEGLTSLDVSIYHIFDQRRFARMAHFAWKNGIGFHPEMFKIALKKIEKFNCLTDEEIEQKSHELCTQADLTKSMFHAAFDLEGLTI